MSRLSVSVIVSVYQNFAAARKTINSVLAQLDAALELELIIVDDGSDEAVYQQLSELAAREADIRLLRQTNQGLTVALRRACQVAQYPLIARIDVGDEMLADRLSLQCQYFIDNPEVVLLGSWVVMYTTEGDRLFSARLTTRQIQQSLALSEGKVLACPAHCSVMFRKTAYEKAGGYRTEFYFAQDLDLWLRLAECGEVAMLERELTRSEFAESSISGAFHPLQNQLRDLAVQATACRRSGESEEAILAQAMKVRGSPASLRKRQPATLYFIGRCLRKSNPVRARGYLWKAIKQRPWAIKFWLAWLQVALLAGFK